MSFYLASDPLDLETKILVSADSVDLIRFDHANHAFMLVKVLGVKDGQPHGQPHGGVLGITQDPEPMPRAEAIARLREAEVPRSVGTAHPEA